MSYDPNELEREMREFYRRERVQLDELEGLAPYHERLQYRRRVANVLTAAVLATSLGAFVSFLVGIFPLRRPSTESIDAQLLKVTQRLESEVQALDKTLAQTVADVQRLKDLPPSEASVLQASVQEARDRYEQLAKRMTVIDESLGENVEKALSVPLMRRDIAALKDVYERHIAQSKEAVDRVYDQNKWFIGLFLSGLITLSVSNLRQARTPKERPPKPEPKEQPKDEAKKQ